MFAQAQPMAFPPWYFWLFVFGIVLVVVAGVVTIVVSVKRADCARQIRERELAAGLIEFMLKEQNLAPVEIERLLDCYGRAGSRWQRFRQLWSKSLPEPVSQKELVK